MLKIRSHRVALSLAFLLSVLAFGANSFATCEKGCTYFEIAIANVTPDTHPYGTYCLEFDDSDRGGHIYTSIGSDLINGDSETDSCKVYRVEDCHVILCTNYNPVVAAERYWYATHIGTHDAIRFYCEYDYDES